MAYGASPLLCELHAHTTWSDGSLSPRELVDLYGRSGFDVLSVTDHCVRSDDPWLPEGSSEPPHVHAANFPDYLRAVEGEAERARALYDLLVIPGLELTYEDPDPRLGAHAVAVGLRSFVGVDDGLDEALVRARAEGAALIAAHPYTLADSKASNRRTARFSECWRELAPLVDRFELFNRDELFSWVAEARLPVVANGDFHRLEHLATWKTLIPCAKDEAAIIGYLSSRRPVYLTRFDGQARTPLAA